MITQLINEGIFVVHALKGYEKHGERVERLFKEQELPFEFMTKGDPSFFTEELLAQYFTSDIGSKMSQGTISATLNHILIYEEIVKRNLDYAIVFENDPYFLGNFTTNLHKIAQEVESLEKGFLISLENTTLTFPSFWQVKKNKSLYQAKVGRMAGAYLMDNKAASSILAYLKTHPCHNVIDWWHNYLEEKGIIKIYWVHPALTEQGSHNGLLSSTISTKKSNLSRRIKWIFQKTYKSYFRRLFKEKRIIES